MYRLNPRIQERNMKIKEGFVLRELGDQHIVVALGKASKKFNGVVYLNETGAFLFRLLKEEKTEEDLISSLLEEYETDEETAKRDVGGFLKKLKEAHLLNE